jgi:hypothetical protein
MSLKNSRVQISGVNPESLIKLSPINDVTALGVNIFGITKYDKGKGAKMIQILR